MRVYFDNSATTRVSEAAARLMQQVMLEDYANPSSMHIMGVEAERYVKEAAEIIARSLKVRDREIIFTSCGTESNNLALIGAALANRRSGKHIITTGIEHASVYEPLLFLEKELGYELTMLPVDRRGRVRTEDLKAALRPDTFLVSTMMVNNEIGAIEPVDEIAEAVRAFNPDIYYHVDAIQAYGKLVIRPKKAGIDMLSASGHKFHGPKGSGFLYADSRVKLSPVLFGGGQQKGMRSGTVNTVGIAGMGCAAAEIYRDIDVKMEHVRMLRDHITAELSVMDHITINSGTDEYAAPHIVSISAEGVRAEVLLHALESRGIFVSSGSACSVHHPGLSGTLKGIGLPDRLLDSTIRVSLSEDNTMEEADYFIEVFREETEKLRRYIRK